MNLRFFTLLLAVCFVGVSPLQAQKGVLKSFTAAKIVHPARILSESEFHLLSSKYPPHAPPPQSGPAFYSKR